MLRPSCPILALLVAAPLVLALGACTDEARITPPFGEDGQDGGGTDGTGSISGRVVDAQGQPLTGVQVAVGEQTGFSDDSGQFLVTGIDPGAEVVSFRKDRQLNTNYRALRLTAGGEVTFPAVAILPLERGEVFVPTDSATVAVDARGTGATYPDSAFASEGAVYLDQVLPYLTVARRGQGNFAEAFPGEFRGVTAGGQEVRLDALGVIWTLVFSQAGALDLAEGVTATYRLGVDPDADPAPPQQATAWQLDPASGQWQALGEAPLIDGVYTAEVASLAPVCWATAVDDVCEVSGEVQDAGGQPIASASVVYRDLAGSFRTSTLTDASGAFTLTVARHDSAVVTPYFGGVAGTGATLSTTAGCPVTVPDPLTVTLPDYRIDLTWNRGYGDLDAHWLVLVATGDDELQLQWALDHVDRGGLASPPFAAHLGDAREEGGPETVTGRRWYEGRSEYWVRDYTFGDTERLRGSGATVALRINQEQWSFPVAEAALDTASSDSSGWWHVFDVEVLGNEISVQPVQAFQPAPPR